MRARLWVSAVIAVAAPTLGACHREATFDERYASAQSALHTEAAEIDAELAARDREAGAAAAAATNEALATASSPAGR